MNDSLSPFSNQYHKYFKSFLKLAFPFDGQGNSILQIINIVIIIIYSKFFWWGVGFINFLENRIYEKN